MASSDEIIAMSRKAEDIEQHPEKYTPEEIRQLREELRKALAESMSQYGDLRKESTS